MVYIVIPLVKRLGLSIQAEQSRDSRRSPRLDSKSPNVKSHQLLINSGPRVLGNTDAPWGRGEEGRDNTTEVTQGFAVPESSDKLSGKNDKTLV